MNRSIIILLLIFIYPLYIHGQREDSLSLKNGILLENRFILIPWTINAAGAINMGDPTLLSRHEKYIELEWTNVVVLDGLKVLSLKCLVHIGKKESMISNIWMLPDSNYSAEALKAHLDRITGKPGNKRKMGVFWQKSTSFYHQWRHAGLRIDLYPNPPYILMEKFFLF